MRTGRLSTSVQRPPNYIARLVMKKRRGIGEETPGKGAEVPLGRSISDNAEDIHIRNRLNVSSIRSK